MLKLLIICPVFYPEQSPRAFRATELAKEFARRGHAITVYTTTRDVDYESLAYSENIRIKSIWMAADSELPKNRSKTTSLVIRSALKIAEILFHYPHIRFLWKIPRVLKSESDFDMIVSIAYPHPVHWGCAWAKKKNPDLANTWVADCGDPFMGNKADRFPKPFYFAYFEKWFCRQADFISIPIESAKKAYYFEFQNKLHVIPQGFQLGVDSASKGEVRNAIPTFAYTGLLMPGQRDPSLFLRYLAETDRHFKFILYARNTDFLNSLIEQMGERIVIRDYIPREQLLSILSQMDFLVNIENRSTVQTPSKLIDYAIAGRPVLSVSSTAIDHAIIDQFLDRNYSNQMKLPDLAQYDIRNVADQFLALCESGRDALIPN